ncbi:MAG: peptide deformylase [Clostridiales Family XIII bacterium]|nr:peptide deformylase [Clostridiales Family XIII bacterium]
MTDPESKDTGEGREADASEATGASATADASEATGKPGETEASGTKAAESADGGEGVAPVPAELPVNAPGGFLYELLNPSIIESVGESVEREGCLSVPGVSGLVKRPERVTVKASDRDGNEIIVKGEGILAKALCHEIDHLEGVLFTDIAEEMETLGTREPGEQEESE